MSSAGIRILNWEWAIHSPDKSNAIMLEETI